MFNGFTDETVTFFLDLRFHNNTTFFHENHDRYEKAVLEPFYTLIDELAPAMCGIDPLMETRPHKCLSHIHRDTRFTKDKSPYRDHCWFLFRRSAEPREKSLNYYFEFGPDVLGWGMGFWGENRDVLDIFRRKMESSPESIRGLIQDCNLPEHRLGLGGSIHKRMVIPDNIPPDLEPWYRMKEMYISKVMPDYHLAFTDGLFETVRADFEALAPLYRFLRGIADDL